MKFAVHPLGPLLFLSMALMPVQSKAQDPNTNAADRALESQQRTLEQRAIDGELQRQLDLRDTQRMPAPAVLPASRSAGEEPQWPMRSSASCSTTTMRRAPAVWPLCADTKDVR